MPRSPKLSKNEQAVTPVFSMRLDRDTTEQADRLVVAISAREHDRDPVSRSEVLRRALRIGLVTLGDSYNAKWKPRER